MKKLLFLLPLIFCACTKDIEFTSTVDSKLFLTKNYNIESKDSVFTVVMQDKNIVAVTDIPIIVAMAKTPVITYIPYDSLPEYKPNQGIIKNTYTVMFEDSRPGDYDYNDLVIELTFEVLATRDDATLILTIDPLALGSTKNIAFGFSDGTKETIISKDVRTDFFNSKEGFLNVDNDYIDYKSHSYTYNVKDVYSHINYFIIVNGKYKYYVASVDKNTDSYLPYGIAIPRRSPYSFEGRKMTVCYPKFNTWFKENNMMWYETIGYGHNV